MRAMIFVNGVIREYGPLRARIGADDYLIGADGGTAHCLAMELRPHVVVGDLDSLGAEVVAGLEALGTVIERHPTGKDQTDLELAIERALADGASEIWLLGALGGRLDQTLANLLILAQRVWPVPIYVAEEAQVARVIRGGETLTLASARGSTVSLIPLSAEVTGITYTGLEYPLVEATLALGSTRGVSNVVSASPATVRIGAGLALVVEGAG